MLVCTFTHMLGDQQERTKLRQEKRQLRTKETQLKTKEEQPRNREDFYLHASSGQKHKLSGYGRVPPLLS